ncbi:MAG: FRG domain-containing protein, partial [Bacteroidales bacterium]|nr:FRG domain-containing protein [Bacteroidales bacterium]
MKEKEKNANEVYSLGEYIQKILDLKEQGLIYRGQPNADWNIESSAFVSLKKQNEGKEPDEETIKDYHEQIL